MLSQRIRTLRKKRGYSQEQLARKLNLTQGAVSQWENGLTVPAADQIVALSNVFGITIDELMKDQTVVLSASDMPDAITDEEKILVSNYRNLTEEGKAALMAVLSGLLAEYKK